MDHLPSEPIEGAELHVWHNAPNGLYERQDEHQVDLNLRGRSTTGRDGHYNFFCLRPTSSHTQSLSTTLLQLLDRHPIRPAHAHFIVSAPDYKIIITQLFDRRIGISTMIRCSQLRRAWWRSSCREEAIPRQVLNYHMNIGWRHLMQRIYHRWLERRK